MLGHIKELKGSEHLTRGQIDLSWKQPSDSRRWGGLTEVKHVRKMITGGIAVTLAVATAAATGAFAGGNGAMRSGLSPQSGDMIGGQCQAGSGNGGNGFVILNAPGKPGDANKLLGEVSLKNATPNTTYMVAVSVGDNNCMPEGSLTTNGVGNGNAHIADTSGLKNGTFYVVLTDPSGNEAFASGPVTVN